MARTQQQAREREQRSKQPPCEHGVRGCVGDAIGTPADAPGPICTRHAEDFCGRSPPPADDELDRLWAADGYEVLRHPREQPAPRDEPLEPRLRSLVTFSAAQLKGNGDGQPPKDKGRSRTYAKVYEVYSFAAVTGYVKTTKNKPTKTEQIKPYVDAQWRRLLGEAATTLGGELELVRGFGDTGKMCLDRTNLFDSASDGQVISAFSSGWWTRLRRSQS